MAQLISIDQSHGVLYVLLIHLMEVHMQKTTVMLDEELLQAAMNVIKARTKREAITAGLEALVQESNTRKLREELGTYDIELDLKGLDRLRNGE